MRIAEANRPAIAGRGVSHADVATEAHKHTAVIADSRCCCRGGAIGGPRLRGGPEIDLYTTRYRHGATRAVNCNALPPTSSPHVHASRRLRTNCLEVAVVPERDQCAPDRGIEIAVGELRGPDGDVEGIEQHVAHRDPPAWSGVHALEI